MKTAWPGFAALALTLIPFPAMSAAPAPANPFAEGRVISSSIEAPVDGWQELYHSNYADRNQRDLNTVIETQKCCIAVFQKGMALLVVRTEPVTRKPGGEPLTERIVRSKWITRRPGETLSDCQLLYIAPQLSLYDSKTQMIRSVALESGEFVIVSWRDTGGSCSFGD